MNVVEVETCMQKLAGMFPTFAEKSDEEIRLWKRDLAREELADAERAIEDARREAKFNSISMRDVFSRISQTKAQRKPTGQIQTNSFADFARFRLGQPGIPDVEAVIRWYRWIFQSQDKHHRTTYGQPLPERYRVQAVHDCRWRLVEAGMTLENSEKAADIVTDDEMLYQDALTAILEPAEAVSSEPF